MKKALSLLALFFLLTAATPQVTQEGRSELTPRQRSAFVFKRGLVNAATAPMEVARTLTLEKRWHPKAWGYTYPFRLFYNFWMRESSAAYDIAINPLFVVPFTTDIRPMTRTFDLPDYPWELEVGEE